MITQFLRSAITFFNAANSEVTYWKQIENLQTELETTADTLANVCELKDYLVRKNLDLLAENKALKDELESSEIAYGSLLDDYYEMMNKHREFKRSLSEFQKVSVS